MRNYILVMTIFHQEAFRNNTKLSESQLLI